MKASLEDFRGALNEERVETNRLKSENDRLDVDIRMIDGQLKATREELAAVSAELSESKEIAEKLRALQKKSIEAMQVLTLYGQEAKEAGERKK